VQYLNGFDYSVIAVYLLALMGLGIYLNRRATASLEDYFLGGKKMPWWLLGVSGMSSQLDVAGTMLIVSFLFMIGPRGLFIEFRGGAVLILALMLLFTGKWNRRSNCMTGAEWMEFRFGHGIGGQFARIVSAIAVMFGLVGGLAYMIKGLGLFLSMFLPFSPIECALMMIGVATLYTMASGFYGVVYTDLFQSGIIFGAVIVISAMALSQLAQYDGTLDELAHQITGAVDWSGATPDREVTMPKGYEEYSPLLLFAFFYLLKNVMLGMGLGQDAKYYGARNERDCGTLTFLWTCLMTFRWPMMIGFAILGLFLVNDLFPDRQVVADTADLVRTHPEFVNTFGADVSKGDWDEALADVMHDPERFPTLTARLADDDVLGADWVTRLKLVSYEGTVNPERILPAVLLIDIPMGFRGLLLIALLAASMSTFDTNVNMSAAYFTRDLYQRFWRKKAANRELMLVTYGFIVVTVALSFLLAYTAETINDIWGWLNMGLGAGLLVPGMLKFYWWRFNAGGIIFGTIFGLTAAVVERAYPGLNYWLQANVFPAAMSGELVGFVWITVAGLLGAILGTYTTRPIDLEVAKKFYYATRPFGVWGPLKKTLPPNVRRAVNREHFNDLIALPFTLAWQTSLFLLPMLAVIRNWSAFAWALGVFVIGLSGMGIFWYRNLTPASAGVLNRVDFENDRLTMEPGSLRE
jgi:SSS family solute:Na+ symporter